jgi:hypothetical protein
MGNSIQERFADINPQQREGHGYKPSSLSTFEAPESAKEEVAGLAALMKDLEVMGAGNPSVQVERIAKFYLPLRPLSLAPTRKYLGCCTGGPRLDCRSAGLYDSDKSGAGVLRLAVDVPENASCFGGFSSVPGDD